MAVPAKLIQSTPPRVENERRDRPRIVACVSSSKDTRRHLFSDTRTRVVAEFWVLHMARVVIAEDHEVVRDGLRRILEAHGNEVVAEIGEGLKVVDVVAASAPDVVLLDLGLPGLHGLDVLHQLARVRKVRVLVLSAEGRDDFVARALQGGARGYLLKSCSPQELVEAVATIAVGGHYVSTDLSDAVVRRVADGSSSAADPYEALSNREREVFYAMAEGRSNAMIGDRLFISARTVETHRAHILKKLGLRSQTDIVLYALRRGVIRLDS